MPAAARGSPAPLSYHRAIVDHLRTAEEGLWNWFSSTKKRSEDSDAVRLDLLKSTYRLELQAQPNLYALANSVRDHMGLGREVTLYQAQTGSALNAALAFLPGEAHVVLSGPLASVLTESELRAVLAHELAHFRLLEIDEGAHLIAADLLRALSSDPVAGPAAAESARLCSLWTEIYADRWAFHVSGNLTGSVAALIKISTGLSEVSAESYLRQADEIFAKAVGRSEQISHPEPYIRARALRLWAEQGDDAQAEIERMIEGGLSIHQLDLLAQKRASDWTRQLLNTFLVPTWFQTDAVLAHAKRFFPDFVVTAGAKDDAPIIAALDAGDESLRDYACYLMLDFVTVDRELGDVALSAAIVLARRLGVDKRFAELAQKELALGKKAFAKIDKDAESLLAKTGAAHAS